MKKLLILFLLFATTVGWSQTTISEGVLKASVSGTEKIPVSGSGHPVINANRLHTYHKARFDSIYASTLATLAQFAATSSAQLRGVLSDETGTGAVVFSTSPTLVTPALGTPSSGTLTNATGLPISTGVAGLGTGVTTFLGTPSSSNLAIAVTGETGSGALVFGTSPALTTPDIGTPSAGVLTNATGLPISTGVSGLGTGVGTFLATPTSANLASALTNETGSGAAVFATSPTLVTPILGTPTSGVATNLTGLPLTSGVTGTLPIANGGTGTTTPAIVAGTNITVSGSWPNQTINSSGGGGGTVATLSQMLAGTDDVTFASPLKNNYVNARVYNVEAYGAKHDYQTVSNASISSGTAILTVGSAIFTSLDVGKSIRLFGAGAAGVDLLTTILSYQSSTQVTINTNASTTITTKQIEWGTDDTPLIQAAINACFTAGGGTVYFPNGIYFIAGALQTSVSGVNPNCQIYFPYAALSDKQVVIRLLGETTYFDVTSPYTSGSHSITNVGGVLWKSPIIGSGTLPSVIASPFANDGFVNNSFVYPIIENINISVKSLTGATNVEPTMTAFKLNFLNAKQVRNCSAKTESLPVNSVVPVSETYGFYLSDYNHNDLTSFYDNLNATCFYYGFRTSEHDAWTRIQAWTCYAAVNITSQANSHALIPGGEIFNAWCKYGIVFNSNVSAVKMNYAAERWPGAQASKWFDGVADVYFPSSYAVYGSIDMRVGAPGSGTQTPIISGTYTGNLKVNDLTDYSSISSITTVGGKTQPSTANEAGAGWASNTQNAWFEINRGTSSGGASIGNAILALNHTNQSGTANAVGSIFVINSGIAGTSATDKRLYIKSIVTNGAVNTSAENDFLMTGGTLTQVSARTTTFNKFLSNTYIGSLGTTPTAKLHLAAGASGASTAPLKFTSGTNNTTAETGAMEYNGTDLLFTPVGTNRLTVMTGYFGQTTLVTGTKAVTVNGVGTGSFCVVSQVTPTGTTLTTQYQCVCTSNTITIQANVAAGTINTADGSVINYMVKP